MSAVASAMPSIKPMLNMLIPRTVSMNTGSRLWISSDDTSIRRLTKPSAQMAGGMRRGFDGAAGWFKMAFPMG